MFRKFCRSRFLEVAFLAIAARGAFAQAPSSDPLVGSWIVSAAKSTLAGSPPRSRYRTIDATHDGMLHVSYGTVDELGKSSFGFWSQARWNTCD